MSVSRKQMDYTQKYIHDKYQQVSIRMPRGQRDRYKLAAEKLGLSVNQLFVQSVEEYLSAHLSDAPDASNAR